MQLDSDKEQVTHFWVMESCCSCHYWITNNLGVSADCHYWMKTVSQVTRRVIVLRETKHFQHSKNRASLARITVSFSYFRAPPNAFQMSYLLFVWLSMHVFVR